MDNPCKIEWLVIPALDMEKTKEFYSRIFGWKVTKFKDGFWLFDADTIHGAFDANLIAYTDGIRFSITVESIDDTLRLIKKFDGKLVKKIQNR